MKHLDIGLFIILFLLAAFLFVDSLYQGALSTSTYSIKEQNNSRLYNLVSTTQNNENTPTIDFGDMLLNNSSNNDQNNITKKILLPDGRIIPIKSFNSSDLDHIPIGYGSSDYITPLSEFAGSIHKLLLINKDNDLGDEYLFVVNGTKILDYNKTTISGNDALDIDGFRFDQKDHRIYAFGDHNYFEGSSYDLMYGLGTTLQNHSIFTIDPFTSKILDSVTLWTQEVDGDETRISDIFINPVLNKLIAISSDDGDLDNIYIVNKNPLMVESIFSIYDLIGSSVSSNKLYDDSKNVLYICKDQDSLIGINLNNEIPVEKKLSNISCPTYLGSIDKGGFFIDYINDEIISMGLATGNFTIMMREGNFSNIYLDKHRNNTILLIAHSLSSDKSSCSSTKDVFGTRDSYIIQVSTTNGEIISIYKFENIYIEEIIQGSDPENIYLIATEKTSDLYRCYVDSKLYNFDTSAIIKGN